MNRRMQSQMMQSEAGVSKCRNIKSQRLKYGGCQKSLDHFFFKILVIKLYPAFLST